MALNLDVAEEGDRIEVIEVHEGIEEGTIGYIVEIQPDEDEVTDILVSFIEEWEDDDEDNLWLESSKCVFVDKENTVPKNISYIYPR